MEKSNNSFILQIIKGVFTALIVTLIAILIFAFVAKTSSLNNGVIKAVNQFIKVLAVFLGCFFSVKHDKGLIKGLLLGGLSAVVITLALALISSEATFGTGFILDIVFMSIIGGISGIISVNMKDK